MRKETGFSVRKLNTDEFSRKYWKYGSFPYQYHTGTIEDGRDEREQFLFNNVRALKDLMDSHEKVNRMARARIKENEARQKKIAALVVANTAATLGLLFLVHMLRDKYV